MRTRFAPSPTGPLHLGHAFSALTAAARAQAAGGEMVLRIDDGDNTRCRPEWEALIFEDLAWLGLSWPTPVPRVSTRSTAYDAALERLASLGLLYPCRCTRRDIRDALSAPQEGAGPVIGPDGPVYPGTCRARPLREATQGEALRLDMARAIDHLGDVGLLTWRETGITPGPHALDPDRLRDTVGDIVLARRDAGHAAYHLTVVIDDADQHITEAVRGADLAEATQIHRLLQALLGLPTPAYHHHRLIRDDDGKRLAKRADAKAISKFRAEGATPADIRRLIAFG